MSQGGRIDSEPQLRAELERQRRKQREIEEADIVVEHPRRLLLRSPNGSYWALAVADNGTLTATDAGSRL